MRCVVMAKSRVTYVDDCMTIREVIEYLKHIGLELSIRRTMLTYGLKYSDRRAFTSRYRQEFNLYNGKDIYGIKIRELRQYRDMLLGHIIE